MARDAQEVRAGPGPATGLGRVICLPTELPFVELRELGPADAGCYFAGISRGNAPSAAVVRRLGFTPAAEFTGYVRYHLLLATWQPPQNWEPPA